MQEAAVKTGNAITNISGQRAFTLFDTYGFPIEMTIEIAREHGMTVDREGFEQKFTAHQELSRTASAGMFKGGLADQSDQTTALHSACHLMLA
jgi:alanyl-tRNA synthetase